MSYDVSLTVHTGSSDNDIYVYDANYTSNVAPMWRAAGIDLKHARGMVAGALVYRLNEAVAAMEADPDKYRAMNPPNEWGDYDGALEFLRNLRGACVHFPATIVQVSY